MLLTDKVSQSVKDFVPMNDRIMMMKLETTHRIMNIIQTYAPTKDRPDDEIEQFYRNLEEIMRTTKKGEIITVLGDLNAKIGEGADGNHVGAYGLGVRSERGDRLIQFCNEQNLTITNTFFKLHPRRLYTWTSPGHTKENIIRNQIDYIMIAPNFKKYIKP